MRWVPSEINDAVKSRQRGLCPFTKNRPHHPSARRQQDVPETRLAHGAPPRRASKNHQWNQVVCGHHRSRAQWRGIKKTPAEAMTIAGRHRAPLRQRSVFSVPGRTNLELMSVGPTHAQSLLLLTSWTPGISDLALQTAPTLEQSIQTILDLEKDLVELDDMVAGFVNAAFREGSHSSSADLGTGVGHAPVFTTVPNEASSGQTDSGVETGAGGNEQRARRGSCSGELVGSTCLSAARRTRADFVGMDDQRWEWQSRPRRRRPASDSGVRSLHDGRA